ncbi:MAG: substrate-binding domain-containing protein [Spirochaetota bacterium]
MDRRWNIGFCIDDMSGTYPTAIWTGVDDRAREIDVNLFLMAGGSFNAESATDMQQAEIYDFLGSPRIDGFVLATTVYTKYRSLDWVRNYFDSYGKPYTSIGVAVPDRPSVLIENRQGLRDLLDHLMDEHGYRKVAFIRGPANHDEAEARFGCYKDALRKYSIPFNAELTEIGNFTRENGREVMAKMLDRLGGPPEAVAAANDYMALGAMDVLEERGYAVPRDCAVVGFDDIEEARFHSRPLSTVMQPFGEQGAAALDLLVDTLEQRRVDPVRELPTVPVIRSSCGCLSAAVLELSRVETPDDAAASLDSRTVLSWMPEWFRSKPAASELARSIVDLLANGKTASVGEEAVLHELERILAGQVRTVHPLGEWNSFVTSLHAAVSRGAVTPRASAFMQKLRMIIGDFRERRQVAAKNELSAGFTALQGVLLDLVSSFDAEKIYSAVETRVPALGFPSVFLSLFDSTATFTPGSKLDVPDESHLTVAYEQGRVGRVRREETHPTLELVPETELPKGRRYALLLQMLTFGFTHFGVMLSEIGPRDIQMHITIKSQIASALQAARSYQENIRRGEDATRRRAEIERRVEPIITQLRSVADLAVERTQAMRKLAEAATASTRVIEESVQSIDKMNAKAREVQELIKGVLDISEQIHLMSINSSIEATRAGAEGRGFSVIAGEIKNLADATAQQVGDIEQQLKGFIRNIDETKKTSNSTVNAYQTMMADVDQAVESLQSITEQMEDLTVQSRAIVDVMDAD